MLGSAGFIFVASSVVLFADICTTQGKILCIAADLKKNQIFPAMSNVFGGVTIFLPSPGLRGVGPAEEIKIGLKAPQLRLLALTVATEETDGYKRFMKSAKTNNIDVKVKNYS